MPARVRVQTREIESRRLHHRAGAQGDHYDEQNQQSGADETATRRNASFEVFIDNESGAAPGIHLCSIRVYHGACRGKSRAH
jgi:hypothetical protein